MVVNGCISNNITASVRKAGATMTSQCCYDVNVAATAAMTSPAATAEYSAESDEVTNAAEGASAKCTSRECQRHDDHCTRITWGGKSC